MKHMIKQLSNNLDYKQLLSFAILSALSLVIWYCGPMISVAHQTPLAQTEKRLYVISFFLLAWLLKMHFFGEKKPNKNLPPEFVEKLKTLEGRIQGAVTFMKKTLLSKHDKNMSLHKLPWYLFIGPAGSGKTTLLANSEIKFILAKQFKNINLKAIPASDSCDWWVTRDLVLVDVPGSFLQSPLKNNINAAQKTTFGAMLWENLLRLVKKHCGKTSLKGVVIALPLPELMTKAQPVKERLLIDLKQRLADLRTTFGNTFSIYITVTKCDLLPGFLDYFNDAVGEETAQAWGITLPQLNANEKITDALASRFNALIRRLNKQLIWRLHQERSPASRPMIKDFPLQIERLKEALLSLLAPLASSQENLPLHGIYLTSAIQHAEEEQTTHTQANASTQALRVVRNPTALSRAYFIKQLLLQSLLMHHEKPTHPQQNTWRLRSRIFGSILGVAVIATILLGNDIRRTWEQTFAIRDTLKQYHVDAAKQGAHLSNALPLLNALQQATAKQKHSVLLYSDQAQRNAKAAYQQALQVIVIPEIKSALENYLLTTDHTDLANTYAVLKAYMMLGNAEHLQPNVVIETLKQFAPAIIPPEKSDQVLTHIRAALNQAWPSTTLNDGIIANARNQLTSVSAAELGFILLRDIPANKAMKTLALGTDASHAFILTGVSTNQLPALLTAETFQVNYDFHISNVADEATQGNWVLGNIKSSVSSNEVAEQMRPLYLANYIEAWRQLLIDIQLAIPTDLAHTDDLVATLSNTNSPLQQLLQTITENTHFAPLMAANSQLAAINSLVTNSENQENGLSQILTALRQTHTQLTSVLKAKNRNDAALQVAATRMQQTADKDAISQLLTLAKQSPEPIKTWLSTIADQAWRTLLQSASISLEEHWQADVMTNYHTQIENRFPLTRTATQEVSLAALKQFFSTSEGPVTKYTKNYLLPFIDSSDKHWRWKEHDDIHIPLAEASLDQLQQFLQFQQAIVPILDELSAIKFTLQPIQLGDGSKSFSLSINGQAIQYDRGMPHIAQAFDWPGTHVISGVTLDMITVDNQHLTRKIEGEWSWFRLVDQSTLKVLNPKQLLLNFDVNGHHAKYYLFFTPGHLNPFLTASWQQPKLPEKLS